MWYFMLLWDKDPESYGIVKKARSRSTKQKSAGGIINQSLLLMQTVVFSFESQLDPELIHLYLNLLAQSWITSNCLQGHWHGLHTLTPWSSLALISAPLLTRYFTVFIWPLSTSKCRQVIWWREMNYIGKQELADIQASYCENYKFSTLQYTYLQLKNFKADNPNTRK